MGEIVLAVDGREVTLSALTLPLWIGRNAALPVAVDSAEVSWYHAWLEIVEGVWVVGDRSRNGTWLDGYLLQGGEQPLREGAWLHIGGVAIQVVRLPTPESMCGGTQSMLRRREGVLVLVAGLAMRPVGRLKTPAGMVELPIPPRLARLLGALIRAGCSEEGWEALDYECEMDLWPGQASLYRGRADLDRWWGRLCGLAVEDGLVLDGTLPGVLLETGFQSGARLALPGRWAARAVGSLG